MNRDDVIRAAREAGFDIARIAREAGYLCEEDWAKNGLQKFERFAALVAAHEREAASERAWKVLINKGADWSVRQMVSDAIKGETNEIRNP